MGLITSSFKCADSKWIRIEYISFNIISVLLLYAFKESQLNEYIEKHQFYMNIMYHLVQIASWITYFMVSCTEAGQIKLRSDDNNEEMHFNIPSEAEQDNNDILIGPNMVKPAIEKPTITKKKYIEVFATNDNQYEFIVIDSIPDYNKKIILDKEFDALWPCNYCEICHFIRPIRSRHCRKCQKCIIRFDHHCPLVNNCVGACNYKYFVLFLLFQSTSLVWTLYFVIETMCKPNINHTHLYYKHTIYGWICRILYFIILFFLCFEIVGLLFFHFYLLSTGQTTVEFMRPDFIDKYLYEEIKRKQFFQKRFQKEEKNDNDSEDIDAQLEMYKQYAKTPIYRYTYYGNINSYKRYWDDGFIQNIKTVFSNHTKLEWQTPIKCSFRKTKAELGNIQLLLNENL